MRVLHIGPISYVGGVSVHILRLSSLLVKQNGNIDIEYIDESPLVHAKKNQINMRRIKDLLKYINAVKRSDIIHIHSVHWLIRIYNLVFSIILRKPFIVTLHSFRINGLKKALTLLLLKRAEKVIVVSNEISDMINHNISQVIQKEAFIPPTLDNEPDLPNEIEERLKNESKILLCANAFRLTSYENMELYGIDQCINVAIKAKKENLNILIIFVIGTVRDNDKMYLFYKSRIEEYGIEKYIWVIPHQLSFISLMKKCSIVLRPTLSDGDALTIREALYLNKTVIASDVVKRPYGTITYKTGNYDDLLEVIKSIINNNEIKKSETEYNSEEYYNFYNTLYKTCNNSHKN